MYKHVNPESAPLKELEIVGVDLVIEIIEIFQSQYEDNYKQMNDAIAKNDFGGISIHAHSIRRNLEIFLINNHTTMQLLYGFETSASTKSYEHKNNDFVKNDVDFKKLFTEINILLQEPLAEIKQLGEEYKTGIRP